MLNAGALYAPELVLVEAMNVLRRLERDRIIATPEANGAQEDLLQLDLQLFTFEPFAVRVWQLRHRLTSYDGWYVALAEALECPLATLDERLAGSAGATCRLLTPESGRI